MGAVKQFVCDNPKCTGGADGGPAVKKSENHWWVVNQVHLAVEALREGPSDSTVRTLVVISMPEWEKLDASPEGFWFLCGERCLHWKVSQYMAGDK